jgi:hypothetical protein
LGAKKLRRENLTTSKNHRRYTTPEIFFPRVVVSITCAKSLQKPRATFQISDSLSTT